MRHPEAQPAYRINQKVHVPYSSEEGIIKGFRFIGQCEFNYQPCRYQFITSGYEYHIYHYYKESQRWSEWEEAELKIIND